MEGCELVLIVAYAAFVNAVHNPGDIYRPIIGQ